MNFNLLISLRRDIRITIWFHKLYITFLKSEKVGKLADCSFSDAILGYSWMNDAHWGVFAKPSHPPEHARQSFIKNGDSFFC